MSYSDNDIIDLLDDLSAIGQSETPEESVSRLVKEWKQTSTSYPSDIGRSGAAIRFLLESGIPHTYRVFVYCLYDEDQFPILLAVPVVRGQYIASQSKFGPIQSLPKEMQGYSNRPVLDFEASDLMTLKAVIKDIESSIILHTTGKYKSLFEGLS